MNVPLEYPLLSDLFSMGQLDAQAEAMARTHTLDRRPVREKLLLKLTRNEEILTQTHALFSHEESARSAILPAGIWLLDNFLLIKEQIQLVRQHLPSRYSRELPRLRYGPSAGYPRVYEIVRDLISHVDGRVDQENLRTVINAYQRVTPLKLGELWAVPIMSRLALIENLGRISVRIAARKRDRNIADFWADRMLKTAERDPKSIILDIADMVRAGVSMTCPFVAQLARRLQTHNPALALALTWFEQRLAEQGQTIERQAHLDSQQQTTNHLAMGNSITSLRSLTSIDWNRFIESVSSVDRVLREDPAQVYAAMDFATRDTYRHAIERMARLSRKSEEDVATQAVAQARRAPVADRAAHIGSYLVDTQQPVLEHAVGLRLTFREALNRSVKKRALIWYLAAIAGTSALFTALALRISGLAVTAPVWVMSILLVIGFSQSAVALVNWVITMIVSPRQLPKMDFSGGIPFGSRTLVTVPTMLAGERSVASLLDKMEVCYLSNRAENVFFSLLTDFEDAHEQVLPGDNALLEQAVTGIRRLNETYGSNGCGPFLLFHRPREWNQHERRWMGYERKRGKLEALNGCLRSEDTTGFVIEGDAAARANIKYVITLDTDTELPRDCARHLIETMSHPLNAPVYDDVKGRIVEGYAVLQPRVVSSMPAIDASWYARVFGSESGIDPYTRAVSDVYQDLFGEGSFIGKGIYDVDMFANVLSERLPSNTILSHDLLEGTYCRSGLISDVQLVDRFPEQYSEDHVRRYRWIRGDWQIAAWLAMRVAGTENKSVRNPVSALSRWKIFDNLRRSVVPAAMLLLIVICWLCVVPSWFGIAVVAAILLLPAVPSVFLKAVHIPRRFPVISHLRSVASHTGLHLFRAFFDIAVLPFEAFSQLDAIVRTCWRMLITRRKLLQWVASGAPDRDQRRTMWGYVRLMGVAPLFALSMGLFFARSGHMDVWSVLFVWFLSPLLPWWISRPIVQRPSRLSPKQFEYLGKIARKTWRYFEQFAGADNNWLPADNYQEGPRDAVAHRTSPTNIGLMLLSNLGAYDMGHLCAGQLIDKTRKSFASMDAMKRFHGHFLNWYDTQTLQPLMPEYVSTVDSGNLAGYLLTLRTGLIELKNRPIFQLRMYKGLSETLNIVAGLVDAVDSQSEVSSQIRSLSAVLSEPQDQPGLAKTVDNISGIITRIRSIRAAAESLPDSDIRWWLSALDTQCVAQRDELLRLAPWLSTGPGPEISPELRTEFDRIRSLEQTAHLVEQTQTALPETVARQILQAERVAQERITQLEKLAAQCQEFADQDYDFLYDRSRHLLTVGYDIARQRTDDSYYDLLASEARLASFVAIAQGKLPVEHWFRLGRLISIRRGKTMLLSWGGSMFEYLMPRLIMPGYEHTLLGQSCAAAVDRQIEYGRERGVPWGISESAENVTDVALNYQYRSFGVPGLGFKRDLGSDLVIAPYASALALMIRPREACANMERLSGEGCEGRYGLYEAVDYSPDRQSGELSPTRILSFMAHHQGMSFISLVNVLVGETMTNRFEFDPLFRTTTLLLQERVPKVSPFHMQTAEILATRLAQPILGEQPRIFTTPHTPAPEVHLLSNGRYHVMVTNAGGGYSRWRDIAVTRWNEDATMDNYGSFVYVNDVSSARQWSVAFQPLCIEPRSYEAIFPQARAEFRRRDAGVDTYTEIAVSPEDDIEHRRITLSNTTAMTRIIELTSYAEVVLAAPASDTAHPAFSNLFVQTEILPDSHAILCTRRKRSPEDSTPWMFHMFTVRGLDSFEISYETDRLAFVGRARTPRNPLALQTSGPLGGGQGSVLDPIVSIRCRLTLNAGQSVTVGYITGMAETRSQAEALVDKYQDKQLADRVFELAVIHGEVVLQQLNAVEADAQLYGTLASSILYAGRRLRASSANLLKNSRGQANLWAYSISGDLPIVLLRIGDPSTIELVAKLIQAHAYWRMKGLSVDLVIWNEERAGYRQEFNDQIVGLIAAGPEASLYDRAGGVFLRHSAQMSDEDQVMMQAAARVVFVDNAGTLEEQIRRIEQAGLSTPRLAAVREDQVWNEPVEREQDNLRFFNGWGGFTQDGKEYVIQVKPAAPTPMPWVNVVANRQFGTVVSQGGGYTWFENAHGFRLTPWYNDPVSDRSGEAIYLRDELSGRFWSATPQPASGGKTCLNRHGFGYSVFEYAQYGIQSELWMYVDVDEPVKFWMLSVRNDSLETRRLSATGFLELVLGENRAKTQMHVRTGIDSKTGALLATNPFNTEFPGRVVFYEVSEVNRSVSGDRTEFIGRNGSLSDPAAMHRVRLSGRTGVGFDPAAAIQAYFEVMPGQSKEIVFILGAGRDIEDARALVSRFQTVQAAAAARDRVWQFWGRTLGAVNVETPDAALNVMANGWLVYQTISSRLWGRSGFYQSGGAFGFRDQLQDVTALVHTQPALIREHLLVCAARQFVQGDVQHWWHPPEGRGVRTTISDDFLWLPLATSDYVARTGDTGVLDETVHFIDGRQLNPEEESLYDLPTRSREKATLYEHCKRAVLYGLRFGRHGLPLMGGGDWNDGMNLVGIKGEGESVWLAFFLYYVLERFGRIARERGDTPFADLCTDETGRLRQHIERAGWDGQWYLRAYCDDGTVLGSAKNDECAIDAIAQSWSVLSGAAPRQRANQAMESLASTLVDSKNGIIKLLDPPFDKSSLEPGYIKGYVPGVRENGGQYTHAAVWAVMAYAMMGQAQRVKELLSMINPVNHAATPGAAARYMVEPYVVTADIYGAEPYAGRGGWSWYTGAAGWMYRLIIESVLGVQLKVDTLTFQPCLPAEWEHVTIHYRFRDTVYHCTIRRARADESSGVSVDGVARSELSIALVDDRVEHFAEVVTGTGTGEQRDGLILLL